MNNFIRATVIAICILFWWWVVSVLIDHSAYATALAHNIQYWLRGFLGS